MIFDDAHHPAQRGTRDHAAMRAGFLMLVVEHKQCPETLNADKPQVTEIEDQRSIEPGETADCFSHPVRIRRIDLAIDAQDGTEAARVNVQLRPREVGHVAAGGRLALPRRIYKANRGHVIAPLDSSDGSDRCCAHRSLETLSCGLNLTKAYADVEGAVGKAITPEGSSPPATKPDQRFVSWFGAAKAGNSSFSGTAATAGRFACRLRYLRHPEEK